MHQKRRDMFNALIEDLKILEEEYNYNHRGIAACVKILEDGYNPLLGNKSKMIEYIMEHRPDRYRTIDTAIPMQYWKDCDTQLSGYAYFTDGTERVVSLPEVIAYIQEGVRVL